MVQERGNIFTRPVREHIHIFSRSASGTLEARRSFVSVKKRTKLHRGEFYAVKLLHALESLVKYYMTFT